MSATPSGDRPIAVQLIDDFRLTASGSAVRLPLGCQRLVARVALAERPMPRCRVVATLWPDASDDRARACLRSALWRIATTADVLTVSATHIALSEDVAVDHRCELAAFDRLLDGADTVDVVALARDICGRGGELLPDWSDDWVVVERERFRLLRMQALDALGERLCNDGRHRDALRVVFAAMAMDPLREAPHRLVVQAHIAMGNVVDAIRQYRAYARLLHDELGIAPTIQLEALLPVR
ncbi:MAG TPA: BTAD domain-containing putative transcriptional regulator [Aldersonia sp.]